MNWGCCPQRPRDAATPKKNRYSQGRSPDRAVIDDPTPPYEASHSALRLRLNLVLENMAIGCDLESFADLFFTHNGS